MSSFPINQEAIMATKLEAFSIKKFLLLAGCQYLALLGLVWLASQALGLSLNLSLGRFVLVFLLGQVVTCFFEWFFHRYVLHAMLIPPLRRFTNEHRLHHRLTPARDYPITRHEQYEAQAFPWWSLSVFYLVFTPAVLAVQWLLPTWPVVIAGFTTITWSLCFYEVTHNCQHKPVAWWLPIFRLPIIGSAIKSHYLSHLMHHKNIRCNEVISGFLCGIPLCDWLFGTYHRAPSLSPDGICYHPQDLRIGKPLAPVVWLDKLADSQERRYKKRSQET